MKINVDYRVTDYDHTVANTAVLEITSGVHSGVKFYFGVMNVTNVEETGDEALLHFEYNTVGDYEMTLSESDKKDFDKMMGDVILSIIESQIEREKENADRKQDTETSST